MKAYIYPNTARLKTGTYNPYIDNFIKCLSPGIEFSNQNSPSNSGIIQFIKYFFKTEVIFFNWIENLPDKKFGKLQVALLWVLVNAYKLKGGKIVWTAHNKISHTNQNLALKKWVYKFMVAKSHLIITHAKEGEKYVRSHFRKNAPILFFPHPIAPKLNAPEGINKEIDILIWGTLAPYKAVDQFLAFLDSGNSINPYRIHIAGKCLDSGFKKILEGYLTDKITLNDNFIDDCELAQLVAKSKIVLFTYHSNSILSSGALMDTIALKGMAVGPAVGAFIDMQELGLTKTYINFTDLIEKLPTLLSSHNQSKDYDKALTELSWEQFSKTAMANIQKIFKTKM